MNERIFTRTDPMYLARQFRASSDYGRLRDPDDNLWIFLEGVSRRDPAEGPGEVRLIPFAPNPSTVAAVKRALKALEADELYES